MDRQEYIRTQVRPNGEQDDIEPVAGLEGVVERIVFESADTGFLVGRMRRDGAAELDTFVGTMLSVSPGETVRLRGRWIEDKKFGRQLKVEHCETLMPTSSDGIEKYLGSGLISGIGPTYAKRLVDCFGVETLRVIDEQPERLRSVPGIGRKRAAQIREAWEEHRALQDIMVFLQGQGIGVAQAVKIYKAYGDKAVTVLRQNPYVLAEDISGIGFQGADKIAQNLGVAKDDPKRMQAGIRHALSQAQLNGHAYLPEEELRGAASELLGVGPEHLGDALAQLLAEAGLVQEAQGWYLPQMHEAELGIAKRFKLIASAPCDRPEIQVEKAIAWAEQTQKIELASEQQEAIRQGIEAKTLIITGGPGTGKTTVINSLLAILEKKGVAFVLAAPTGRAAKRMEAATGREASTLHRLLEFSPRKGGFTRDESNPIATDLLVVDEASMIDAQLMHALLRALPPFARLILVGDVDQLPSVGAGNVLLDCIASNAIPVVRLKTIFRQAEESGIVHNAHLINAGKYPEFNQEDFFLIERNTPESCVDTVLELLAERMPKKFGLDPVDDIQVLSPMRRGEAGVNRLNEVLQARLNPKGAAVPRRNFRVGDKVMQLRNNYELDVFNGDVGRIVVCAEEAKELEILFDDGRKVVYPFESLDDLGLAYAATVHKAQGSEYGAVVIPLLSQHYMMLQRNVLYTAVTRGKQLVILVGDPKAVGRAVRNVQTVQRYTHLSTRLRRQE